MRTAPPAGAGGIVPSARSGPAVPLQVDLRRVEAATADLDAATAPYRLARLLTDETEILRARRLHATVYLARGYITPGDVARDGTIGSGKDPWPAASTYFGVSRGDRMGAVARQISVPDSAALPTLRLAGLDAAEVSRIRDLPAGAVVEISAVVRHRDAPSSDVVSVYVRMWEESLRLGHRAWLLAVDRPLFRHLRTFFGGEAVRPIGPEQFYLGSVVVPAVIWCDELNPEQRRLAQASPDRWPLRPLLPQLFPHPSTELVG